MQDAEHKSAFVGFKSVLAAQVGRGRCSRDLRAYELPRPRDAERRGHGQAQCADPPPPPPSLEDIVLDSARRLLTSNGWDPAKPKSKLLRLSAYH